jgi:hypothetical protein
LTAIQLSCAVIWSVATPVAMTRSVRTSTPSADWDRSTRRISIGSSASTPCSAPRET